MLLSCKPNCPPYLPRVEVGPRSAVHQLPRGALRSAGAAQGGIQKDGRKRKPETVYLLTSLPPEVATPQLLLQLNRASLGIENRVHWVRDVALREDASRQPREM